VWWQTLVVEYNTKRSSLEKLEVTLIIFRQPKIFNIHEKISATEKKIN
jgi:hypothetical protein